MEEQFKKNIAPYSNIKLYQEESHLAAKWIRKPIDFLFVDGDHSYKGCKSDCEKYLPKIKENGFVGFHDYNSDISFPGVRKAVEEFTANWHVVSNEWSMIIKQKRPA